MFRFAFIGQPDPTNDKYFLRCVEKGLRIDFLTDFQVSLEALSSYRYQSLFILNHSPFFPAIMDFIRNNPLLNILPRLVISRRNEPLSEEPVTGYPVDPEKLTRLITSLIHSEIYRPISLPDLDPLIFHLRLIEASGKVTFKFLGTRFALYFVLGLPLFISSTTQNPNLFQAEEQKYFTAEKLLSPKSFISYLASNYEAIPRKFSFLHGKDLRNKLTHQLKKSAGSYTIAMFPYDSTYPRSLFQQFDGYFQTAIDSLNSTHQDDNVRYGILPNEKALNNLFHFLPQAREILKFLKTNLRFRAIERNVAISKRRLSKIKILLCKIALVFPLPEEGFNQISPKIANLIDAYLPVIFQRKKKRNLTNTIIVASSIALLTTSLLVLFNYDFIVDWNKASKHTSLNPKTTTFELLRQKAEMHITNKELITARQVLLTMLKLPLGKEERSNVLLQLGELDTETGKYSSAEQFLNRVKTTNPENPRIFLSLGNLYLNRFRISQDNILRDKAVQYYFTYLDLLSKTDMKNDPNNTVALQKKTIRSIIDYLNNEASSPQ